MILTIAIVAYAVGVLISARILAGHLAWKWKSQLVDRPEMLDWLTAGLLGLAGGARGSKPGKRRDCHQTHA